jgi:cyclopropane fatty-acyl-phospholipid synthase-like methyltransferase
MPDDPHGPRSSRPAEAEVEGVASPRRRVSAVRIPEDHVARPLTPPIAARTVEEAPISVKPASVPPPRLISSPDAAELRGGNDRGLEDFLMDPAPASSRTRQPTLIDPFEASAPHLAPTPVMPKAEPLSEPSLVSPVFSRVPGDAPSVLDLDDVGGELDDTPQQPAVTFGVGNLPAAGVVTTPAAPPVRLAPPPAANAPVAPSAVRTPAAAGAGNGRSRSRLGVDSMPPQARPWWEALFQDDYVRFSPPRTEAQIEADVRFIEQRLNLAAGARILDVACGDGGHAASLASRGFDVVGIDTSLPLLARASARAQNSQQRVQFQQLDMRDLAESSAYDGALVWDHGFGFFDDATNESVLAKVHRALRPRGQVLLDVLNRDYAVSRLPSLVWFEGQRCICMDDAHIESATSRLVVHRTVLFEEGRSREYDFSLRLFSAHELRAMLERVGFRIVEVSGQIATPGAFFGADSPRLIVLAERPLAD